MIVYYNKTEKFTGLVLQQLGLHGFQGLFAVLDEHIALKSKLRQKLLHQHQHVRLAVDHKH